MLLLLQKKSHFACIPLSRYINPLCEMIKFHPEDKKQIKRDTVINISLKNTQKLNEKGKTSLVCLHKNISYVSPPSWTKTPLKHISNCVSPRISTKKPPQKPTSCQTFPTIINKDKTIENSVFIKPSPLSPISTNRQHSIHYHNINNNKTHDMINNCFLVGLCLRPFFRFSAINCCSTFFLASSSFFSWINFSKPGFSE